jgi:hypothetical protein
MRVKLGRKRAAELRGTIDGWDAGCCGCEGSGAARGRSAGDLGAEYGAVSAFAS